MWNIFPQLLELIILGMLGVLYVFSGGALLPEWGRKSRFLSVLAFIIAFIMTLYFYRDFLNDWNTIISKIRPISPGEEQSLNDIAIQPRVDFTPDPTTAAFSRVHVIPPPIVPQSIFDEGVVDPRLGTITYEVGNLGWSDDMRNLDFSLWALVKGQLIRVHQRHTAFLAKGESIVVDKLAKPFITGRMAVCISYEFKGRKVNIVDFYTNENLPSSQNYAGQMMKFRESLKQVDSPNDLCSSMPSTVTRLM